MKDASTAPAWSELQQHACRLAGADPADLLADETRAGWALVEASGLSLDLSRQRIDRDAFDSLVRLAQEVGLRERIEAMYRGDVVNVTEGRAALHTALRREYAPFAAEVSRERERMFAFAEGVRRGDIGGSDGKRFDLVVNIGIGGSDLGPAMVVEALRPFAQSSPKVCFVSNVDGTRLSDILAQAEPARTLFIVCSKTFTTVETLTNAATAKAWIQEALGAGAVPAHFAAVSTNAAAMNEFGVHPDHRFAMWDWVGGRYSLWSPIGVSIAVAIGSAHFREMLRGASEMDEHFRTAAWDVNLPALMALLGVWNINFLSLPTLAILPYDDRLARFPAYLQQLDMESNGKGVRADGSPVFCATAPVIWGEPGNNAQHSFFQLLHQGTPRAALDFLLPARSSCGDQAAHDLAIANCLAQAEAFATGQPESSIPGDPALARHKVHPGGRPSSLLMFSQVDPHTLGKLIALYEHKVFAQSVVWGINAFDQWGVELGKRLARAMQPLLRGDARAESPTLRASILALRRFWL